MDIWEGCLEGSAGEVRVSYNFNLTKYHSLSSHSHDEANNDDDDNHLISNPHAWPYCLLRIVTVYIFQEERGDWVKCLQGCLCL